jgi:hypothetical protein
MAYAPLALLLNERAEVCIELPRSPRSRAAACFQLACALVVVGREQPERGDCASAIDLAASRSGALAAAARQSRVRTSLALQRGGSLGAMARVPTQYALAASLDRLLGSAMGVVEGVGASRLRDAEAEDVKRICAALALVDARTEPRETVALLDTFVKRLVGLLARGGARADDRASTTLLVVVDHSTRYEARVLSLLGDAVHNAARQMAEGDARAHALLARAGAECTLALKREVQGGIASPGADTEVDSAAGAWLTFAPRSTPEVIDCTYVLLHAFEAIACAAPRGAAPRAAKRRRIHDAAAEMDPSARIVVDDGTATAHRARVRLAAGIALSFAGAFNSGLIASYATAIYRRLLLTLEHGAAESAANIADASQGGGAR